MIAETVTRTMGINWESVAVISAAVLAIVGTFTTWISRQITHAINDLSIVLQSKLETKEVVQNIEHRLTVLEMRVREAKKV
jgi:hypothetical protein